MANDGLVSVWRDTRRLDRLVTRYVWILVSVLAIVLVAFSALTYLDARARKTDQIRLDAAAVLQFQIDEETAMRGYDATGDRRFLEPYMRASQALHTKLASLRPSVTDAAARAALDRFAATHEQWTDSVARPVMANPSDQRNPRRQEKGKDLIDSERRDASEIESIYAAHFARLTATRFAVRYVSMSIVLLVITAVAWSGYVAERRNMRREEELLRTIIAERDDEARRSEWRTKIMAMLAHDFRSSLGVILAYAEMLESFPEKRGDHEIYDGIREAVEELTAMSEEALLMARVANNMLAVAQTPVPVRDIIRAAASRYVADREIAIEGDEREVLGDRRYLLRVFDNLLSNAVKYSPAGTPVRVVVTPDGDRVEVCVIDRGPGIESADLPHVFEEFWRAKSVGERSGSGIGLFIVKKIVEAHGGSVSIESNPHEGTSVRVLLPAAPASVAIAG